MQGIHKILPLVAYGTRIIASCRQRRHLRRRIVTSTGFAKCIICYPFDTLARWDWPSTRKITLRYYLLSMASMRHFKE